MAAKETNRVPIRPLFVMLAMLLGLGLTATASFAGLPTQNSRVANAPAQGTPTATGTAASTSTGTVGAGTATASATTVPCGANSNYLILPSTGVIDPGTSLVPGSQADDSVVSNVTLPFPVMFYDQVFNSMNLSTNGNLQFTSASTARANTALPAPAFNNAIFGHWDDLDMRTTITTTFVPGIYTSTVGTAPNRTLNIEWRSCLYNLGACNAGTVNFEIRLHENSTTFEVVYGNVTGSGISATAGVQRDTGSRFTQFSFNQPLLINGLMLTYFLPPCGSATATTTAGTATGTAVGTGTGTVVSTGTATRSATALATASSTGVATASATRSATAQSTSTGTALVTATITIPVTGTSTAQASATRSATTLVTSTITAVASGTSTAQASATRSVTAQTTSTTTAIASGTTTAQASATRSVTAVASGTTTAQASATRSVTAQVTRTGTAVASSTAQPSGTSVATRTQTAVATGTTTPGDRVEVCHRTGSQHNPYVRIEVSRNALPAHLRHGDIYPVPEGGCPADGTPVPMTATPEPTETIAPCNIQFNDVPPSHTFYPYVRCLACRQVFGGYEDGTFRPDVEITRGQLAKIVSNTADFQDTPVGQQFTDVPPSDTFYVWIERLAKRRILGGYEDGTFRPYNPATRGQIAKIVANAGEFYETVSGQTFTDVKPGDTFYEYIQRMAARQIVGGYNDGTFRPNNHTTRGQVAKMVGNGYHPDCQTP